jgi:hypothetical protein
MKHMRIWGLLETGAAITLHLFSLHLYAADTAVRFAVASDMRYHAGEGAYDSTVYFRGGCEAMRSVGGIDFLLMPGDIAPPEGVEYTIQRYLSSTMPWYPVVGNHDAVCPDVMNWLRAFNRNGNTLDHVVNPGPANGRETIYSFDYGNAHFVVLNQYYDGSSDRIVDGRICRALYDWLAADLQATDKQHVFVAGHEPAYPQPDRTTGNLRHAGDSLDKYPDERDAFWGLLQSNSVLAYIHGHTHGFSAVNIGGVWQIDSGHCGGIAELACGNPSTFTVIDIQQGNVYLRCYRDNLDGGPYRLKYSGALRTQPLPVTGDFDGDGCCEQGGYRMHSGQWSITLSSTSNLMSCTCGGPGMTPVPADYDGDGITDCAAYDTANGNWYIRWSTDGRIRRVYWGRSFTDPVPADYDGDGKTDCAVFYPAYGNWYIRRSSDHQMTIRNWGWAAAQPLPGDYDGDGRADFVCYHQDTGNWFLYYSRDNAAEVANWGWSEAVPVPADYDGDGRLDIAVWHAAVGEWYVRRTGDGHMGRFTLGNSACTPLPHDYNADGLAEPAVYDGAANGWLTAE